LQLQLKGKLAAALLKAHNLTAVILSDTDVAWLRDPADLVELQPEADILISTDCLSTKTEMSGVINGNRWASSLQLYPPPPPPALPGLPAVARLLQCMH
jgi:hypothetical protein